ncbi:MAG: hypothetical protein ABIP93_06925 [Gemmatimonadaceae bacterium]
MSQRERDEEEWNNTANWYGRSRDVEQFATSSSLDVVRDDISLVLGDTTAVDAAFRGRSRR